MTCKTAAPVFPFLLSRQGPKIAASYPLLSGAFSWESPSYKRHWLLSVQYSTTQTIVPSFSNFASLAPVDYSFPFLSAANSDKLQWRKYPSIFSVFPVQPAALCPSPMVVGGGIGGQRWRIWDKLWPLPASCLHTQRTLVPSQQQLQLFDTPPSQPSCHCNFFPVSANGDGKEGGRRNFGIVFSRTPPTAFTPPLHSFFSCRNATFLSLCSNLKFPPTK